MALDAQTIDDLTKLGPEYDAAALATPGIATYCSARDWAVSAAENLHPGRRPFVARRNGSWLALTHGMHEQVGPYFQPLESDWGFSSPLLGEDPRMSIQLLWDALQAWEDRWQVTLLHGLTENTAQIAALALEQRYRVVLRDGIRCQVASLEGGIDGFLSRRSTTLRRNLRRDARRASRAGIVFEVIDSPQDVRSVMDRILDIEQRSWKHSARQSVLASARYRAFYLGALTRAAERGGLRAAFASRDGQDLAYVFGATLGDKYRGFQLGYDEAFKRYGLGNQLQLQLVTSLCADGVTSYDLGMEMAYKSRWAEQILRLRTLVIVNPA